MIPVHQTLFGDGKGNCVQAALASILEMDLEDVPNVIQSRYWWEALNQWLKGFGLEVVEVLAGGDFVPAGYHLIGGQSPRGNFNHVVVGHNGKMVHDPHPDGDGLTTTSGFWIFVSLNPQGLVKRTLEREAKERTGASLVNDSYEKLLEAVPD